MHRIKLIPKIKWLKGGGGITSKVYKGEKGWYKINYGDTLSEIAKYYGVTTDQLKEWNPDIIKDVNKIYANTTIRVAPQVKFKPHLYDEGVDMNSAEELGLIHRIRNTPDYVKARPATSKTSNTLNTATQLNSTYYNDFYFSYTDPYTGRTTVLDKDAKLYDTVGNIYTLAFYNPTFDNISRPETIDNTIPLIKRTPSHDGLSSSVVWLTPSQIQTLSSNSNIYKTKYIPKDYVRIPIEEIPGYEYWQRTDNRGTPITTDYAYFNPRNLLWYRNLKALKEDLIKTIQQRFPSIFPITSNRWPGIEDIYKKASEARKATEADKKRYEDNEFAYRINRDFGVNKSNRPVLSFGRYKGLLILKLPTNFSRQYYSPSPKYDNRQNPNTLVVYVIRDTSGVLPNGSIDMSKRGKPKYQIVYADGSIWTSSERGFVGPGPVMNDRIWEYLFNLSTIDHPTPALEDRTIYGGELPEVIVVGRRHH